MGPGLTKKSEAHYFSFFNFSFSHFPFFIPIEIPRRLSTRTKTKTKRSTTKRENKRRRIDADHRGHGVHQRGRIDVREEEVGVLDRTRLYRGRLRLRGDVLPDGDVGPDGPGGGAGERFLRSRCPMRSTPSFVGTHYRLCRSRGPSPGSLACPRLVRLPRAVLNFVNI